VPGGALSFAQFGTTAGTTGADEATANLSTVGSRAGPMRARYVSRYDARIGRWRSSWRSCSTVSGVVLRHSLQCALDDATRASSGDTELAAYLGVCFARASELERPLTSLDTSHPLAADALCRCPFRHGHARDSRKLVGGYLREVCTDRDSILTRSGFMNEIGGGPLRASHATSIERSM
jgi:hypothetical protein